ncbi:MAG: hypothetical protein NVSMB64_27600 [Candidatus Velthaea sp.]
MFRMHKKTAPVPAVAAGRVGSMESIDVASFMERLMSKLLRRSRAVVLTSLVAMLCSVTGTPSAADESLPDMYTRHVMEANPFRTQTIYTVAIYQEARRQLGSQRIHAGRASTTFQRIPGYLAPSEYAAKATDASQRQQISVGYAQALRTFENEAAKNHLRLTDVAETYGLVFTMSYEVFSGAKVNAVQRNSYIQQQRNALLHDALFQGTADKQRQLDAETRALDAVIAADDYAAALRTNDGKLRDYARQIAWRTLKDLWTGPVSGIELTSTGFGDRGARLIREGKATTRFVLSPTPYTSDPQGALLWRQFVRWAGIKGAATDLGKTQALIVAICYEVYTGRPLNAAQSQWVERELGHDLLVDPSWQGTDDSEKQQSLEPFAIAAMSASAEYQRSASVAPETLEGVWLTMARENGVDNASQARAARDHARQVAKANLDKLFAPRVFDDYVLVEDGFRLKSGTRR